jgi:hypothetical protein
MSNQPTSDYADLPPHPLLRVEITEDGRVLVDGWQIEVPHGDVRAAAVNAAEDYAANRGHPVRVTVRMPHGQSANLIAAPGVRVDPRPQPPAQPAPAAPAAVAARGRDQVAEWSPHDSPAAAPTPSPASVLDPTRRYPAALAPAPTMRVQLPPPAAAPANTNGSANGHVVRALPIPAPAAAHRDDAVRAAYALLKDHPQPPQVAAEDVPAWPSLAITLAADGSAQVEGRPVPAVPGFSVREAAIAAAALHVRSIGLMRPVRAVATEPDGTQWPLIVHVNGSASAAGHPVNPPKKKRLRRERSG